MSRKPQRVLFSRDWPKLQAAIEAAENGAPTDWLTRFRLIIAELYQRVDYTMSRPHAADFRGHDPALNLASACQDAEVWMATDPEYLEYGALVRLIEIFELELKRGSVRAITPAARSRGGDGRERRARELFAQKKAASPKASEKTIKAEIRRKLKVHRSTVNRWFPDKTTH